ncbi:hypothetical protein [Novosphingopyxis baekryungensis]|uniref:hypothetical protein n=1 Tax=Novosphingopyxis baekryungensis TaxID=279369 RepID=UPI0003B3CC2E|nr:hypothetical protein [Novosphingopyxis baekryungensis]
MAISANEDVYDADPAAESPVMGDHAVESAAEWIEDEPEPASMILPIVLIGLAAAWTAFFIFAQFENLQARPGASQSADLIVQWAVPLLLIGMIWLLAMRTSHREARRFADVSGRMQDAGAALQHRMQAVNNEISLAREFLAEQARELDMLGRTRARDIREAAQSIEHAFAESQRQAAKLDEVSQAANGNLERLRNHLPVVTSTAKDVTNQIATAGEGARIQLDALVSGAAAIEEATERLGAASDRLHERSSNVSEAIDENSAASERRLADFLQDAEGAAAQLSRHLQASIADLLASLDDSAERQRRLAMESASTLQARLSELDNRINDVAERGGEQGERIVRLSREIEESAERARARIHELDERGSEATARIAFAIKAALDNSDALSAKIEHNDDGLAALQNRLAAAHELMAAIEQLGDDRLLPSVERVLGKIDETNDRGTDLRTLIELIDVNSHGVQDRAVAFGDVLSQQRELIDGLNEDSAAAFTERREDSAALEQALMEARGALQRLAEDVEARLSASVEQVRDRSIEAADHARSALDGVVETTADNLRQRTTETLEHAVTEQMEAGGERWNAMVAAALHQSDETTKLLEERLAKLDQMTSNLEVRLERAHEQFEGTDDDAFARRVLMLTESLNSTSIDVAKLLSNDVTDPAWAAYLKGDRGVFTRRAVRLLDAGEVRIIAQHYEEDREFRNQVNRYIHDFESIMRNLMSTRDGSAISVTLLSSDVGKLYVALAQAIERLRA